MLRFLFLVALQLTVIFTLRAPKIGWNPLVRGMGLAAVACLIAGPLFLFPRQALLITPILITIPAALVYVRFFEWIFLVSLGAYLLRYGSVRFFETRLRPIDITFILYILWGCVSLTGAVHLPSALLGIKTIIVFFLAFQVGSRVFGGRTPFVLFRVYAVTAIAVALQEFLLIASRGYTPALLTTRMAQLTDVGWGVSVYVSAVAVLAASASLPAAFFGSSRERVLSVLAVAAGVFSSVVSLGRGSLLALIAGLVVCALSLSRRMRVPALILIGAVAVVYLASPLGRTSLERFTSPQGRGSVGVRLVIYREAVQIALAHPIFGVGPSQMQFHSYFHTGENPHNIFLKNAVDFGFVGLVLYIALLGWVTARWFHLHRRAVTRAEKARSLGIPVLLSTALVNAAVEPTLEAAQYGFLFWFLVGALTAPDDASVSYERASTGSNTR